MFSQELVKEKVGAVLLSHEIQSLQVRTARKEWKVLVSAAGALRIRVRDRGLATTGTVSEVLL